jgi:putative tryptophan/tyrosine transport system substrate-binding protein
MTSVVDRRRFLVTSVAGALTAPLAADAQQAGKVPRIGYLHIAPRAAPFAQAFDQKLRELGYVEGKNIAIEFRTAEGRIERLPDLATELVALKVDVIVTATEPAARAAKGATNTIPIVMAGINYDPIALGYVASLARPGGNVTGVFFRHIELTAKRLELFKEMLPTTKRIAVLSDPLTIDQLREVEAANTWMRFTLHTLELRNSPFDFGSAFASALRFRAEALFVLESSFMFRERVQIAQLALKNRLPTSFAFREYVEAGGLMAYGANFVNMAGLAAVYVDKILKGAKPADLPIEQPTKFELVINLKTAKAIGLTIPPSLLARADQVIE